MYISRLYPGGPRELIKHGENGLLFKVEDVEDLVNQMRLVLNNQVSATSIAKNAKIFVSLIPQIKFLNPGMIICRW